MLDAAEVAPRAPAAAIAWVAINELFGPASGRGGQRGVVTAWRCHRDLAAEHTLKFVATAGNRTIAEQFRTERGEDD
jgi:hypothetical protein